MSLDTGLGVQSREATIRILNTLLADEYVLSTRTRNYHWNVVGPRFPELHAFFETQYEALDGAIDEIAERVRALGGRSAGSLAEFLALARLDEAGPERRDADTMLADLLAAHETLVRTLRQDVEATATLGDAGTSDFLTGLMEAHEKTAWMLRATVEK